MVVANFRKSKKEIIEPTKLQVFLASSPCNFPFFFATHNWFVINKYGEIERWESGYTFKRGQKNWGHLRINDKDYLPFQGIHVIPKLDFLKWRGKVLFKWEGEEAVRLIDAIHNSTLSYPYQRKYGLVYPNSNTYVKWILRESKVSYKLPFWAIGMLPKDR